MITIFTCFMIVIMVMVCGIGVDIMRHEMERNLIQSVADRAVLAAADLDQELDPEAVVRDYFLKAGASNKHIEQCIRFWHGVSVQNS